MRKIINMNDSWTFEKEGKKETVCLPHCWNAVDGQETAEYYRGVCSYERELPEAKGNTYLELNAVNSCASVYVNGKQVGSHKGGYSMFRLDITSFLNNNKNVVKVLADNRDMDDVYPSQADFTFYGGIYRDVNLITELSDCHFSMNGEGICGMIAVPGLSGTDGTLEISPFITGNTEGVTAQYSLYDALGNSVAEQRLPAGSETFTLSVKEPVLWDGIKKPYLYTLKGLLFKDDELLDRVETHIGFRTVHFDSETGCTLNGKHIKLKGVSRHQDRFHMGNALTEKEHREDLELIKEVGANSIRLAHYQHDQKFYDLCDKMGFLVWAEVPVISRYSVKKEENAKQQLTELITQNRNHPAIFCWGIQNEISMSGKQKGLVEWIKSLNNLAHRLDPTRPTASAQVMMCSTDSELNRITDILGYNLYFGWYLQTVHAIDVWLDKFHKEFPQIKLCLSEYGAEGIVKYQNNEGVQGDYSETYQARFHEHYARAIEKRDWLWGSYVWNMFDFGAANRNEGGVKGRNNKGLVTIDRKIRKDSFYVYKAFWSDEPFVHIGGQRYADRVIGKTTVPVYSNLDEVTLIVNGKSETKPCDRVVYFTDIEIADGQNKIQASAGDCTHEILVNGVAQENPEYKIQGSSGSVVRNWFEAGKEIDPSRFSVNDRVGEVLKNQEVQSLLNLVLSGKKIHPLILKVFSPFKVKTILKLLKMDEMADLGNQYLQGIKK